MRSRPFIQKIFLYFFLVTSLLFTPSSGVAFTISQEKEIGEKLLFGIRKAFKVIDEPDIAMYINGLGAEVLGVAGYQYFDYRFYIIEDKDFNAFAAPSGLIFFHTGLIETMETEDELVSVVAHEIGHITKRHLASRIKSSNIVNMASLAVALGSLALGDAKATAALLTGSLAAGQSAQLSFSRQHEEEADLLAYQWMLELGRSPLGQEKMLQTMRRITRYRMGQIPQYLLTHPNPEARLDYVQSLLAAEAAKLSPFKVDKDDFSFLRFKFRVLSQTQNPQRLRQYLAAKIASQQSSEIEVIMAKYGMAQLDRHEKNFSNSLKLLGEVIDYFPDESILKIDRGNILLEAGEIDKAIDDINRAYKSSPGDSYAAYSLAKASARTGKYAQAKRLYQKVAQSMGEYSSVYYELGRLASIQKEQGESSYYLGLYNLYEGKLKLAKFNFETAKKDNQLPKELQRTIPDHMATITRLLKS